MNTYNVAAEKYRDNKEELFIKFIDSMLAISAIEIKEREGISTQVLRGHTPISASGDSSIYSLLKKHGCTHAIAVTNLKIIFDQTGVDVTKTPTGKEREANYNIVCDVDFKFYTLQELYKQTNIHRSGYHSSRNVISGLLAAGPNIVVQRKDAWKIARECLEAYLNMFFEGR